ncbi:MAG TPA: methionine adenosyltransferase [Saprospiraceae bacterium]|nr:methionine adenosyltransferase [Saprospiraceae bacterium]MCB9271786.1 methionine adenosyltransferase [Lewinellaceae bacterium]HPG07845.1 methionine adenosyltransferase [Saprospiraceae bacterium]HQU52391.1 methionine adenosyltransferase [Saprospiraceae bacterium]HRV87034.1 methionine adenosyltransferase [Saprospiraceae bacterium]
MYLFTSESVSEGHPDKVADQISDAILDAFLSQDPKSKVACETLVTTGLAVVSGEVRSSAYVDIQSVVRETIQKIGYTKSEYKFDADACGVVSAIHEQSPDIAMGVDVGKDAMNIGAGDQGMMFGYATNETSNYMPLPLELSHMMLRELAAIRKAGKEMTYLRPDSKAQVTLAYEEGTNKPLHIDTIVVSTQHDDFAAEAKMLKAIKKDVQEILIPRVIKKLGAKNKSLFDYKYKLHVNPTGKFVIGGPHGDTGLTGRKIIVDTYGGKGAHGGGAFSGKDSTKVDRSAAYAMRHLAKNMVAAGLADQCLVQVAYAIGVAEPVGLFVDTYGTSKIKISDGEIAQKLLKLVDLRPAAIIKRFGLQNPIFFETAAYGHMGRKPGTKEVMLGINGQAKKTKVETFTWEKLDLVDTLKEAFH